MIDVIQSKNEYALKSSVSQLKGSVLEKYLRSVRRSYITQPLLKQRWMIQNILAFDGYGEKLQGTVEKLQGAIRRLLESADNGRIIKEGIQTVIVGKPNAGKSSLLNVLAGKERAIVTDIEGTTRDILEENIQINGISLNIIDTAGIRDTEDIVEKIGVDKAKDYAKDADLIIYVVDASRALDENDEQILEMIREKQALILLNKSDLDTVITKELCKIYRKTDD